MRSTFIVKKFVYWLAETVTSEETVTQERGNGYSANTHIPKVLYS